MATKKRFLAVLLCLTLLGALAACGTETDTSGASSETPDKPDGKLTIGYSTRLPNDQAQSSLEAAVKKAVEDAGAEYVLLTCNSITDVATQANHIDDLINMKVDAIIVNPNDGDSCLEALQRAKDAGIPAVTVDGRLSEGFEDRVISQFCTASVQAGELCAQMLMDTMPEGGNVIVIRGANGNVVHGARSDGFIEALKGSKWKVVGEMFNDPCDNDGALKVTENLMASANYDIQAAFSITDTWFPGMAQAIDDAKLTDQVKLVGIDGFVVGCEYIQKDRCVGIARIDLPSVGQKAVECLMSIINGEKTAEDYEPVVPVDCTKITPDNVEEAIKTAY